MPESHIIHTHPTTSQRKPFAPSHAVVETSGSRSGWRGFVVERHRLPAIETPEFLVTKPIIALQVGPPMFVEWKERGRYTGRRFTPGEMSLTPAPTRDALRWREAATEILVCELDPAFLTQSAREMTKREDIELRQVRGVPDARIAALLSGLKADMDAGHSGGTLFGEILATALAVHLVQSYSAATTAPRTPSPLARRELRRAINYIYDNLESDLRLHDIAGAAGLSPSHFARLFKEATGQPPHRYALTARIERAQSLLRPQDASVSAVAARLGFHDESHFIRHFKRITGTTPGAWRER